MPTFSVTSARASASSSATAVDRPSSPTSDCSSDSDFSIISALNSMSLGSGRSRLASTSRVSYPPSNTASEPSEHGRHGHPSLSPSASTTTLLDEYEIILVPSSASSAVGGSVSGSGVLVRSRSDSDSDSGVSTFPSSSPSPAPSLLSLSVHSEAPSPRSLARSDASRLSSNVASDSASDSASAAPSTSSSRPPRRIEDDSEDEAFELELELELDDDSESDSDSDSDDDSDDDSEDDDEDGDDQSLLHGDASSSDSEGTQRPSTSYAPPPRGRPERGQRGSNTRFIVSASHAQTSIDSFFTEPEYFMSDKANKLRLWQSLCIEFGLVELEGSAAPSLPDLPSESPSSSRSTTPRPTLPPLPTTLTQARLLLKNRAHVNIVEYIGARDDPQRHAKHGADAVGKYADLVYSSTNAMLRATRKAGKFHPLGEAKKEWLEPLLKDFGIHRRRVNGGY